MLQARVKSGKNCVTEVQNIEFISKQPSKFFVFTFSHSSLNSVFIPVHFVAAAFPSHPFAYFLTSGFWNSR